MRNVKTVLLALLVASAARVAAGGSGLVGYWKLDEGSGTSAVDSSVNTNDGTLNDMEAGDWDASVKAPLTFTNDYALNFDSTVDSIAEYVSVPRNATLEPTAAITLAFWYRRNGAQPSWARPVWYGQSTVAPWGPYGFIAVGSADDNLQWHLSISGGGTPSAVQTGPILLDLTWYHIAGTYDGSVMRVYVDGVETTTYSISGPIDDYDVTNGLGIGAKFMGATASTKRISTTCASTTGRSASRRSSSWPGYPS